MSNINGKCLSRKCLYRGQYNPDYKEYLELYLKYKIEDYPQIDPIVKNFSLDNFYSSTEVNTWPSQDVEQELGVSQDVINKLLICLKGRKKITLECIHSECRDIAYYRAIKTLEYVYLHYFKYLNILVYSISTYRFFNS